MTTIAITMSEEQRAILLGVQAQGILGKQAYDKVLKLSARDLRSIELFAGIVADLKEAEEDTNV